MLTQDMSFRIVTSVEGMTALSKDLPALLGKQDIGLRGFKLLPINGDISTCILTVAFMHGDMTPEERSAPLRHAIANMCYIASIIIVPTAE